MRKLASSLAKLCRLPVQSGFVELDLQIEKLKILRDSYQNVVQVKRVEQTIDLKSDEEQLCLQ